MSEQDALEKLKWYRKKAMESPLGSKERFTWIGIVRDVEALIKRMTPTAIGVNEDSFDLNWDFQG
jgi:hypothetical protein